MAGGTFKELLKKYGKVAFGVHFSLSTTSIAGLFVALKNNVDVETMLETVEMPSISKEKDGEMLDLPSRDLDSTIGIESEFVKDRKVENKENNSTTELAASSGSAFALVFLINKVMFPVWVPITLALMPPVVRFLARRNLVKTSL